MLLAVIKREEALYCFDTKRPYYLDKEGHSFYPRRNAAEPGNRSTSTKARTWDSRSCC